MKKVSLTVLMLFIATGAFAQIERGDTEVSFLGYYVTYVGEEGVSDFGSGSFQLSYGKYISSRLLVGIAPTLSLTKMEDEVETSWSGSVFFSYNFSTASKFIPYLTGQYYQYSFDIPEGAVFTDYGYATVGIGFKNFFNEYASFNTLINYGFSLAENAEGGILIISTGLSFLF